MSANTSHAVMAQKRRKLSDGEIWQDAELFPTPPWATRALFAHVLPALDVTLPLRRVWEPCTGLGHMAHVLAENSLQILRTDKYRYMIEAGYSPANLTELFDFLDRDLVDSFCKRHGRPTWIITNPPFGAAEKMLAIALETATDGVAFLLRLQWMESEGRYKRIFTTPRAPSLVAIFSGRVAMCEGGWDPQGSTATAYAWFVFQKRADGGVRHDADWSRGEFLTRLIPPDAKQRLTRDTDRSMAAWHVPGFVPPSTLKKSGKAQERLAL